MGEVLSPIALPCGRILQNRLTKVAMYEHGANALGGPPTPMLWSLYSSWGEGQWGMLITGNIQVSKTHLTMGCDMVFPTSVTPETVAPFRRLATAMHGASGNNGSLAIAQISHTGRQAANFMGGRFPFFPPLAPSATRVGSGASDGIISRIAYSALFQTAREMSPPEIEEVIAGFVRGAVVAMEAGFDGVQLHASHGYLLAQFISPKTNLRTDEYSEPLCVPRKIVQQIRSIVPREFVVGIKLNAADYVSGGLTEAQAISHVREIATWAVDFIEISGGDYESPEFMNKSPGKRQAFFEQFSRLAVKCLPIGTPQGPSPLILLTGGLRTRSHFASVLRNRHAHLLGLGRLSVLHPHLPAELKSNHDPTFLKEPPEEPSPATPEWFPKLVGASVGVAWYVVAMRRIADGEEPPVGLGTAFVLLEMYLGKHYLLKVYGFLAVVGATVAFVLLS